MINKPMKIIPSKPSLPDDNSTVGWDSIDDAKVYRKTYSEICKARRMQFYFKLWGLW